MITPETFKRIIEVSVNAPSGSNSQPWRFEVVEDKINVLADPEKDHPVLNYKNRGTWIAHGALIENIKISANALGWQTEIKIFPDPTNPKLTAQIKLSEARPSGEELFQIIPQRVTNRKRYDSKLLTAEQKKYLQQSVEEVGGEIKIILVEDRNQINRLGQAVAANEIITLENQKLHELFFNEIVWTREEEVRKEQGLFVKTMELKPLEEFGLRLFKHWSIMRVLAKLGAVRKIAAGNAKNYAATPLMGLVLLKDNDRDFLTAGRVIERIWLKAARLGLGFHLITGIMFFRQGMVLGGLNQFSETHRQIIAEEYQAIRDIAGPKEESWFVTAVFRVGVGGEPTARSTKRSPEINHPG